MVRRRNCNSLRVNERKKGTFVIVKMSEEVVLFLRYEMEALALFATET